jgi:adenine/guanine phosphoribosyltransferase-like PRPP-binding protein
VSGVVDAAEVSAPTTGPAGAAPWSGQWVTEHLGISLRTTTAPLGPDLTDLVGLAVRRNARRAHLLVSLVLGKHVPTEPRVVYDAGVALGELVRRTLSGSTTAPAPTARGADQPVACVVLGYAETATGLGHCVADALGSPPYLHSTRRPVPGVEAVSGFEEEHSHATTHLLLPADPAMLRDPAPLVLVDDELSTGRTALNTITALHRLAPRERYVIAALVDLRGDEDRARLADRAAALGTRIDVVALGSGRVELPPDVLARSERILAAAPTGPRGARPAASPATRRVDLGWPEGLPETARHGFGSADRQRLDALLSSFGARLAAEVTSSLGALRPRPGAPSAPSGPGAGRTVSRVLVLGSEELMYVPLRLAMALVDAQEGAPVDVRYSTTTRSPVLAVDEPGYAIRTALSFPAHDGGAEHLARRFVYNVSALDPDQRFDVVVLVIDEVGDTPALGASGGLLDVLAGVADKVLLVVLPDAAARSARAARAALATRASRPDGSGLPTPLRGPAFGSYAPDEVAWLLTDLSDVPLEAPTEDREEAIQAGGAHYAESLPIEYQPTAEYQRLFHAALAESADRLAHAVGVVTERVLAARPDGLTLVSLARAGTPIGILMRRWAQRRHGVAPPHYAVSIVRGRGIDTVALDYLAAHHDPRSVMFVDGWTGKGAIARELQAALEGHAATTGLRFASDLAVLADPGHCVRLFGTRDDYLIPSACLNSTVSGLVSRTVLNRALIGPGDWHGAKFYAGLASADVSNLFLDAVTDRFDAVADAVECDWPVLTEQQCAPDWSGWTAVERIAERYGIGEVNLVKPGVGETTRVLLRRVPWRVLVRADAEADLGHVRLLAAERGVPVETVPDLPYSCVGLIHPGYSRTSSAPRVGPARGDLGDRVRAESLALGLPQRLADEVAALAAPPTHPADPAGPVAGPVLVGCDLDRTLIYSASALGLTADDADAPRMVVAEVYRGIPLSFCTRDAETLLDALAQVAVFVPVTTRTRAQFARIRLPGPTPRYAIAANGGHILVDGVPCEEWAHQVAARLESGCAPLGEVVAHLDAVTAHSWLRSRHTADDLFAYLVVERDQLPHGFIAALTRWCADRGWTVSLQGRKVYCVPEPLSKAAAFEEIARRVGAVRTFAAGDSLLDASLLETADLGVRPAHGELHDTGWHLPHVAVTHQAGVLAGQETLARLLAGVLTARHSPSVTVAAARS